MEETASIREFGRIMGYSDAAVGKWIRTGKIDKRNIDQTIKGRPRIFVERAKKDVEKNVNPKFAQNSDPVKRTKTRHNKKERAPDSDESWLNEFLGVEPQPQGRKYNTRSSAVDTVSPYADMNFTQLQEVKQRRDIELLDVKIGEASKELVKKADVYAALFRTGQEIRDAIQAIPDRTVDDILLAKSRDEVYDIMAKEIHSVLTALADAGRNLPL